MRKRRLRKRSKLKCVYCKKYLDTSKPNYGWHYNEVGAIEKCYFSNMPIQVATKMRWRGEKKEVETK